MRLILIRHAESLANVDPKFYRFHDSKNVLSGRGISQAKKLNKQMELFLGKSFRSRDYKALASGLTRTQLTAYHALKGFDIPVTVDERLNELEETLLGIPIEPQERVRERMIKAIKDYPGNLIIFSHCNALKALLRTDEYIHNCEVKMYKRDTFEQQFMELNIVK